MTVAIKLRYRNMHPAATLRGSLNAKRGPVSLKLPAPRPLKAGQGQRVAGHLPCPSTTRRPRQPSVTIACRQVHRAALRPPCTGRGTSWTGLMPGPSPAHIAAPFSTGGEENCFANKALVTVDQVGPSSAPPMGSGAGRTRRLASVFDQTRALRRTARVGNVSREHRSPPRALFISPPLAAGSASCTHSTSGCFARTAGLQSPITPRTKVIFLRQEPALACCGHSSTR